MNQNFLQLRSRMLRSKLLRSGHLRAGRFPVLIVALCLGITGCGPADQIERHVMSFEDTGIPEPIRLPPAAASAATPAVRSRMVTAIAALPTATWFFKAVGPVEDVAAAYPALEEFLKSVRFDERGQPVYAAPGEWQLTAPRPGRFQTYLFGPGETATIELAISELGPNQDLPSNVNRWRGQLELPPLAETAANESLQPLAYEGGEFLMFDEIGMYRGGMAPAAGGPPPASASAGLPTAATTAPAEAGAHASLPFEYQLPDGWKQLPNAMFATLKMERSEGDKKVAISVSEMNPELNTWESALGSWLAELELSGLEPSQVEPFESAIEIDGHSGKQIRLLMPDAAKGIIAARVERDGRAWFVKLSGEKSLVEESQTSLDAFLNSIRFK